MSKKKDEMADLVCKSCKLYLSIGPILISKSFNGPVCGRCKNSLKPEDFTVADFYEPLVKTKSFPCRYKSNGCKVVSKWGYVEQHEETCNDRLIHCPIVKCNWKNKSIMFNDHLKQVHDKITQNPVKFKITDDFHRVTFVSTVSTDFFIVNIVKKSGKVSFIVTMNGSPIQSTFYRYQVEIFDGEAEMNSIILRKNQCFTVNENNINVGIDVQLNTIRNLLNGAKEMIVKFGIVRKNDKEVNKIMALYQEPEETKDLETPKSENTTPKFDQEILSELECPICQEYMCSPIFLCSSGHSFCAPCINKMQICPTCRCSLKNKTRNFSLEKIASKTKVPCKNAEIGCVFHTTVDKIIKHENECKFEKLKCVYSDCEWQGDQENYLAHIKNTHKNKIHQMNLKYTLECNETRIILLKNEIFFFTIVFNKNNNQPLEIKVETFKDSTPENFLFRFELLQDPRKFVFSDFVIPYAKNNRNIIFTRDIVKKFATNGKITYQICISKCKK